MCVDAEARMAALEHLNEAQGPEFKIKKDPPQAGLRGDQLLALIAKEPKPIRFRFRSRPFHRRRAGIRELAFGERLTRKSAFEIPT